MLGRNASSGLAGTSVRYVDSGAANSTTTSYFDIYYHEIANEARAPGTGYDDGILLASGTVSLQTLPSAIISTIGAIAGGCAAAGDPACLSSGSGPTANPNTTSMVVTDELGGSMQLKIEFIEATINKLYVVNDLTTATVDLTNAYGNKAPYDTPAGAGNQHPASDHVGGSGKAWVGGAISLFQGDSLLAVNTIGGTDDTGLGVGPDSINNSICDAAGLPSSHNFR